MPQAMMDEAEPAPTKPTSRWQKIQEVIWDGPRSEEERKLVQRLDLFFLYGLPRI